MTKCIQMPVIGLEISYDACIQGLVSCIRATNDVFVLGNWPGFILLALPLKAPDSYAALVVSLVGWDTQIGSNNHLLNTLLDLQNGLVFSLDGKLFTFGRYLLLLKQNNTEKSVWEFLKTCCRDAILTSGLHGPTLDRKSVCWILRLHYNLHCWGTKSKDGWIRCESAAF